MAPDSAAPDSAAPDLAAPDLAAPDSAATLAAGFAHNARRVKEFADKVFFGGPQSGKTSLLMLAGALWEMLRRMQADRFSASKGERDESDEHTLVSENTLDCNAEYSHMRTRAKQEEEDASLPSAVNIAFSTSSAAPPSSAAIAVAPVVQASADVPWECNRGQGTVSHEE